MMHIGEKISQKMKEKGISQNRLAKSAQISQSGLSSIINGASSPKQNTIQAIAAALGCQVSELIDDSKPSDYGIVQMIRASLPVVGSIACGTPITAEQNIESYADVPEGVHADFALRCKGDSMSPTLLDGDLVLIRSQPDVNDSQIAAVIIDGEATLKHVYHQKNGLLLTADNPSFPPIIVTPQQDEFTAIQGLAIGYMRMFTINLIQK